MSGVPLPLRPADLIIFGWSCLRILADKDGRSILDLAQFSLGMYLIHAFQSCLIPAIPRTIPKGLWAKFADINLGDADSPNPSTHLSTPSLSPQTQQRVTPPASGSNTPLLSINTTDRHEQPWEILPHEKLEADKQFVELDVDKKGYIETDVAAKFLMGYDLPPNELGRIWYGLSCHFHRCFFVFCFDRIYSGC